MKGAKGSLSKHMAMVAHELKFAREHNKHAMMSATIEQLIDADDFSPFVGTGRIKEK